MPVIGFSLGIGARAGGLDYPATLPLTGWWRAFAGSPWPGTASAGGSASRELSQATNSPDIGTTINGFTTADFEQANTDFLDSPAGTTLDTFFNANAGSAWALIRAESTRADQANAFNETTILGDACNFFGLVIASSGVRATLHDGAWKETPYQALATGVWGLAQVRWNGTSLESRVNGGIWQAVAAGNISNTGSMFQPGRNVNAGAAAFYDGLVAELGIIDQRLSDIEFDNILAYARQRYAQPL